NTCDGPVETQSAPLTVWKLNPDPNAAFPNNVIVVPNGMSQLAALIYGDADVPKPLPPTHVTAGGEPIATPNTHCASCKIVGSVSGGAENTVSLNCVTCHVSCDVSTMF